MNIINFPGNTGKIEKEKLYASIERGVQAAFERMTDAELATLVREQYQDFLPMRAAA